MTKVNSFNDLNKNTHFYYTDYGCYPLVVKSAKPGRRLKFQCSQTQPNIAAYLGLFKFCALADALKNTLDA